MRLITKYFNRSLGGALAIMIAISAFPITASASPTTGFEAGRIIDDSVFLDFQSMNVSSIQSFLNAKGAGCTSGSNCLKNYRKDDKSAAQMIYSSAQKYKINPKTLIVLLQKETGLVTVNNPESWRYRTATGYGCPDTAACDTKYYGLSNQLNWAAKMFSSIIHQDPDWYSPYRAGYNPRVYWHPDTGRCGSKALTIENWSTAALYSYTPYRPNQAALDAGYGTGNSCSAYGNRNFYIYFKDWFGPPNRASDALFVRCEDGKNYLIERTDSRKRLITSQGRIAWGLTDSDFLDIEYGCDYPQFDAEISNLVRSRDSGKLYLVDKANAYYISSQDQASAWGLGDISQVQAQANAKTISQNLNTVSVLPRIAKSDNTSRSDVYLIDDKKRYTIDGTPENEMSSHKLITAGGKVPSAVMSVPLLQTLALATKKIDYSIQVGSSSYLIDNGTLEHIAPETSELWSEQTEPTELSNQSLSIFQDKSTIGDGFYHDSKYYLLTSPTTLSQTSSPGVASNWSRYSSPPIVGLLKDKILTVSTVNKTEIGLSSSNNIRIVTCNGQPYMIERLIKSKRKIGDAGMNIWRLTDKYFFINDRACDYSEYAMPIDNVVRSRESGKLYKLQDSKAYWAYSKARARELGVNFSGTYPNFEAKSINSNFSTVK